MSPESVVNARRGLLGMARHGFDKHLERALQQHVDAAVVVIIVAARQRNRQRDNKRDRSVVVGVCVCERETDRIP